MKKNTKRWALLGILTCVLIGVFPTLSALYIKRKLEGMGYTAGVGKGRYTTRGVQFQGLSFESDNLRGYVGEVEVIPGSKRIILRRGEIVAHMEKGGEGKQESGWSIEIEDTIVHASTSWCEWLDAKILHRTKKSTMVSHMKGECQGMEVEATVLEKNESGWSAVSVAVRADHFRKTARDAKSMEEGKTLPRVAISELLVSYEGVTAQSANVVYENRELRVGKSKIEEGSRGISAELQDSVISTLEPGQVENYGVPKYKLRSRHMTASIGTVGSLPVVVDDVKVDVYPFLKQYEATVGGLFWFGSWDFDNHLSAGVDVEWVDCQVAKDLIPAGEDFKKMKVAGIIELHLHTEVGPAARAGRSRSAKVDFRLKDSCKFEDIPDVYRNVLEKPVFVIDRVNSKGALRVVTTGPGRAPWVRYEDISPHMTTAVLATEDSSFFLHGGVSVPNIQDAMREDIELGRFRRGGSTITMQLAKNLWLQREKTLSRKMQEFFLTKLLEERFPKKKILEYYFNVVEFGPDLYGIQDAAEQLFGVQPKDLTIEQSLALAMLLPNPRANVVVGGRVTDAYKGRVQNAMRVLHDGGKIDDDAYEKAGAAIHHTGLNGWDAE